MLMGGGSSEDFRRCARLPWWSAISRSILVRVSNLLGIDNPLEQEQIHPQHQHLWTIKSFSRRVLGSHMINLIQSTERSYRGWIAVAMAAVLFHGEVNGETREVELHTAKNVRDLTVEEAREQRAVRLRGVVTFYEESLYSRFIQDETAGV